MNPIFAKAMAGETICRSEVNNFNATKIMDWVKDTESHHAPESCRNDHCVHAPGPFNVDWAATLVAEAAVVCTCGKHGIDDPVEAATIVTDFHKRW